MIPRLKPWFGRHEALAVLPTRRDSVEAFEGVFAKALQASYAVAFPYGRSALYALLKVLGCEGVEVALPAYTCVVVAHAIVKSGNIPLFVDVLLSDFNMDLDELAKQLTPQTRVVLATSMYGYPVDIANLQTVAGDQRIIIQDCALAIGTTYQGQPIGNFGLAAIYGLNIGKQLSTLQGGMVTTNDPDLYHCLRAYRNNHFRQPPLWRRLWYVAYLFAQYVTFWPPLYGFVHRLAEHTSLLDGLTKYYDENQIELPADFQTHLTALQGRIGITQIGKLKQMVERRRTIAQFYDQALSEVGGLLRPPLKEGASYSHYTVRVNNRRAFVRKLAQYGFNVGTLFDYAIPALSAYHNFSKPDDTYPRATTLAAQTVNLPNYPSLTIRDTERIGYASKLALADSEFSEDKVLSYGEVS